MDKTAIKTFAINSRKKLIEDVEYKMSLVGITKDSIDEPMSSAEGIETYNIGSSTNSIYDNDIEKRKELTKQVKQKGFENVVEEVAYTWFNRIIAIRFMEINNFLPTKTRVLSSETPGKIEPDIITNAFNVDLDYTQEDKEFIFKLKDENKLDELFRFLFIKQCNKLNEILPGLFEKTDDYLELLLNISFTNEDGVVRQLINTIPEEDFGSQVEIIGWLYQFYNSELKDETFANLKKRIKISKERIPAATQLFTPDWIVKYMVENSVGRLWLAGHPNSDLKSKWRYYVEEAQQDSEVEQQLIAIRKESEILKPEDITVIDPCMGSGHILVYVFEVLMDIYVSEGYTEKDACESILKNNLYGLDIDKRAYQLAYFAVLMKARKYNRKILTKNISPLLCSIEETNSISEEFIDELISQDKTIEKDLKYLYNSFYDAKEYGSILINKPVNYNKIIELISNFTSDINLKKFKYQIEILIFKDILKQSVILSKNYDVVITNPPYMGNNGMNSNLKDYLKSNFKNTKNDLSTVFMERSFNFAKEYGFISMINIPVWMFISSYEKLRTVIINEKTFINMLHLGRGIFGSDFGTTAFILQNNSIKNYKSTFKQLYKDKGAVDSVEKKEQMFFNDKNNYIINQNKFDKIPGSPMAYWVSDNLIDTFEKGISIDNISDFTGSQNITADNNKYLRYFWEINFNDIGKKWVNYAKGGNYKKYYGNIDLVVDWSENARDFYKNNKTSNLLDEKLWFKEGITYTAISSKGTGFRYMPTGCIFDKGGPSIVNIKNLYYCLGFLNSNLISYYLNILNPTINIQTKDIKAIPLIIESKYYNEIERLSKLNVSLTEEDWNEMELSLNFEYHPLLKDTNKIDINLNKWKSNSEKRFNLIKSNEINLNKYFIEIYNVPEISYEVNDEDVTLIQRNLINDIKSFISYAVGCMFGRYSLDNEGLQYAGGEFDINNYQKFIPDDDNIIPVLDTAYFDDDIVGYFTKFVETCFGSETLEENLDFIAGALSNSNKPSREIIRDYLVKNFFNDHVKTYKKCPIYWQFSSGKQNGFNCLVYMHRYEPSLVARIRTDYLHKTQKAIEQRIENNNNIINNSSSKQDVARATKEKAKLQKQLKETQEYDEVLAHIANQNIEIDLDDGVKVNYAKFQNIEIKKEGSKTKK